MPVSQVEALQRQGQSEGFWFVCFFMKTFGFDMKLLVARSLLKTRVVMVTPKELFPHQFMPEVELTDG